MLTLKSICVLFLCKVLGDYQVESSIFEDVISAGASVVDTVKSTVESTTNEIISASTAVADTVTSSVTNVSDEIISKIIESITNKIDLKETIVETEVVAIEDMLLYNDGLNNPDINLTATEIMNKYGYTVEEHTITTEDGYILTFFRIPKDNAKVVYLMHEAESSSDDWVTAGPSEALVYVLADAGYDVWIANTRGNKYTRGAHVNLTADCSEYWDYTFDEIGYYDLPASIDYILDVTGQETLSYVGQSQGNTVFYVMCSERPQYNDKINCMMSMSTAAWLSNIKSPVLQAIATLNPLASLLSQVFGVDEFLPDNGLTRFFVNLLCGDNVFSETICSNFLFLAFGYDRGNLNITNLPVVFSKTPGGASTKQLIHILQLVKSGNFEKYDYGSIGNLAKYGTESPPDYPVEKITAPVAILYGDKDWVSDIRDVLKLKEKLQNVIDYYLVENYSHVDFQWGKNPKEKVYKRVLELLEKYAK